MCFVYKRDDNGMEMNGMHSAGVNGLVKKKLDCTVLQESNEFLACRVDKYVT